MQHQPSADTPVPSNERRSPLHLLVPAALVVLAALTALVVIVPGFQFAAVFPEADLVLNSATTLAAGTIAVLAWIRYSQTDEADSLLQSAAFLTLFAGGALWLAFLLTGTDAQVGFERASPGQAPLYLWTAQRSVAALLLLLGGVVALRRASLHGGARARLVALLPAAAVTVASIVIIMFRDALPALVPVEQLRMATTPSNRFDITLLSTSLVISQAFVAGLYVLAALAYARLYRREAQQRPYVGWLAAGLAVAAFSHLHFSVTPGVYSDLLTSGDVLRLTFYGLILAGVAAAARGDLVALSRANETLTRLRASDARRITLEERSRLAREVHDGLVQDLWLARLTHGRLTQMPGLPREGQEVAQRVDALLENALAEARQAIVAMQPTPDPSFGSLLVRFVEDIGDRYGLDVECTVDGEPVRLAGHAQAEVLRVCREALNNVRKHADASLVRVHLESDGATLTLRVTDNGRGFDTFHVRGTGFGLQGMRDRADRLGARLEVDSAPMNGTRVTLSMPAEEAADTTR